MKKSVLLYIKNEFTEIKYLTFCKQVFRKADAEFILFKYTRERI